MLFNKVHYRRRKSGAISVLVRRDSRRARLAGVLTLAHSNRATGGLYGAFEPARGFNALVRPLGILGADEHEVLAVLTGELTGHFGVPGSPPPGETGFLTGARQLVLDRIGGAR